MSPSEIKEILHNVDIAAAGMLSIRTVGPLNTFYLNGAARKFE